MCYTQLIVGSTSDVDGRETRQRSAAPRLVENAMIALSNSPNHFLTSLSLDDAALLQPHLKPMDLPQGAVLYRAEDTISRIYFPRSGAVSLVVGLSDGQFIEAATLGRNSVIGVGALTGRAS
jgi:CRP-like cAMP-binding protein